MSTTYTPIIGLEIHVGLHTKSKMFCGCVNDPFHAPEPNTYVCPVCFGLPGALPVANRTAVEWTIQLGLAVGSQIAHFSKFDRKHYFYPDLPKGYQISQYDQPLAVTGKVATSSGTVNIHRIHLEEDTGKLIHKTIDGKNVSLIDYNRSGIPLVEIVTEPELHSAKQAREFAQSIQQLVRTLGISDADMEKGSMRLEANISLTSEAGKLPHYKVEIKNINSFKYLEQAIGDELQRQEAILQSGKTPPQETRGWNEKLKKSIVQRTKESAEDYRYFPDPDLPPMEFSAKYIESLRDHMPELPQAREAYFKTMSLSPQYVQVLMQAKYDHTVLVELFSAGKKKKIDEKTIASYLVQKKKVPKREELQQILTEIQSSQVIDPVDAAEISRAVSVVLKTQSQAVSDYKSGKTQVIGFLMGAVMKQLGKKVDPNIIMQEIKKSLS